MSPRIVTTIPELRSELDGRRAAGDTVGFVPTMGGLHAGHQSLMEKARQITDLVVASIFVNPLQFGDKDDLLNYPRDMVKDAAVAQAAGVDIIFAPSVQEMYPDGEVVTSVRVSGVSDLWEGATRPGHFDGVATVVSKLFNIVGPCSAFFGEKDWQQLAVIRQMVSDLSIPVSIVGCPIIREEDGLAMSSRNVFLVGPHRKAALCLRRAALLGKSLVENGETNPNVINTAMEAVIEGEVLVDPVYAVVVDPLTLQTPKVLAGEVRLLLAAQVGIPRLIDNEGAVVTITSIPQEVHHG